MRVSIVTVTYNAESTIERTLQSVAAQKGVDVEHIIMDGKSKDRTAEIALKYQQSMASEGRRVVVVSEPDKGLYDAMNKAIALATGDFICFLNAGDKLHGANVLRDTIFKEVKEPEKVGVFYGNTDIVDDEGNFLRKRRLAPPEHLTWKSFKDGMLVCHQAFYVNRSIAQEYNLEYRFSADFDWCIRCMKEGDKQGMKNVYTEQVMADYLSEGMTTANHKASLNERFRIMAKHYGWVATIAQHIWFVFRVLIKK